MKMRSLFTALIACLVASMAYAAPAMAPAVPDLNLPSDQEATSEKKNPVVVYKTVTVPPQQKPAPRPVSTSKTTPKTAAKGASGTARVTAAGEEVVVTNDSIAGKDEYVEKIKPDLSKLAPVRTLSEFEAAEEAAAAAAAEELEFETARAKSAAEALQKQLKVVYNPSSDRDPTLSPEDTLLVKAREEQRKRDAEAERRRRIEAERRRIAEEERQRQLQLELLKDPSRAIRGKIKISGIVGKEVFIGSKVYTVGQKVMGAEIVSVQPDAVVFRYKGQRFTKKVQLQ